MHAEYVNIYGHRFFYQNNQWWQDIRGRIESMASRPEYLEVSDEDYGYPVEALFEEYVINNVFGILNRYTNNHLRNAYPIVSEYIEPATHTSTHIPSQRLIVHFGKTCQLERTTDGAISEYIGKFVLYNDCTLPSRFFSVLLNSTLQANKIVALQSIEHLFDTTLRLASGSRGQSWTANGVLLSSSKMNRVEDYVLQITHEMGHLVEISDARLLSKQSNFGMSDDFAGSPSCPDIYRELRAMAYQINIVKKNELNDGMSSVASYASLLMFLPSVPYYLRRHGITQELGDSYSPISLVDKLTIELSELVNHPKYSYNSFLNEWERKKALIKGVIGV